MEKIIIQSNAQSPIKSEIVEIGKTKIYYEVYGTGKPLFLFHGYTQSSKSWHQFVPYYLNDFAVYLVDLKGHGKSGMFTEKLSIRSVAQDVDVLIRYLKLDSVYAIGFSYGGDVLMHLALMSPDLIKSMIIIGACGSWVSSESPKWVDYLSYKNIENLPWMREQQTSEEQIHSILDQIVNYNITVTDTELKTIKAKTLIVVGDKEDSISFDCIISAKDNIPNSFLWIVPNTDHRAHKDKNQDDFIRISKDFFTQNW
jgi:pimeloyl-ACP methyl ester carboxylesterase